MTAEFSLLYRWHSLIPDTISWGGTGYPVGTTIFNNRLLIDVGLVRAFGDLSSQQAGRLGAFNTSPALLAIEESAIRQGRLVNLASYAAYRKYASLRPPSSFEEISTDPKVVDLLKTVYQTVDRVEYYPGLFAEDPTPKSPLPPLILTMVAVDAFSQALTNPLLSEHVFNSQTFSKPGWETIHNTRTLREMLDRNQSGGAGNAWISMTSQHWKYD